MVGSFAVGWRQVAACFMMLSATGMITTSYSILAAPLGKEFHPSRMTLMLSMTVMSAVGALLAPVLGSLMDRVKVRNLMALGGVLLSASYFSMSLATSFDQILWIFALLVAPANVLLGPVAATVLLSRWFALKRGRAMGIAIAGIGAGGFFSPFIIQTFLNAHDWRVSVQLFSLVLLIWTVPVALLVVDKPSDRGLNPDGEAEPPQLAKEELAKAPISIREVLTDPSFWMIAATVAIVTAGMKGMVTNLASLAIDNGIAAKDAALLISVYSGTSFIGKLSFAALADRLGPRILMLIALGGYAIGMTSITLAGGSFTAVALSVATIGILGGLMIPIESFIAPRMFGQRGVGRAMGMLSGVILIALLSSPPLFGLIFDLTGNYKGIFWTFAGLAVLALLWVPAMRLHPRDAAPAKAVPAE